MKKVLFISGLFSTDRIILLMLKNLSLPKFNVEVWTQNSLEWKNIVSDYRHNHFSLDIKYDRHSIVRRMRIWHNRQFDFRHYSYYRKIDLSPIIPVFKFNVIIADFLAGIFYKYFCYFDYFKNNFKRFKPDNVVLMWPYDMSNINVGAYSKLKNKKVIAFVTGFDNLSTKSRIPNFYDKILVWSESMKLEFLKWYPTYNEQQVRVVGAPQYDVFFDKNYKMSKEDFNSLYSLDPNKKTILFAIGSPNLLNEVETFLKLYELKIFKGFNVLLRLHPGFNYDNEVIQILSNLEGVYLQYRNYGNGKSFQNDVDLKVWVSSFSNCDILINTSSTVILDAAIFNKYIINLDFEFDKLSDYSIKRLVINDNWFHIKKLLKHNCIIRVSNINQLSDSLNNKILSKTNDCSELIKDFFDDTLGKSTYLFWNECIK